MNAHLLDYVSGAETDEVGLAQQDEPLTGHLGDWPLKGQAMIQKPRFGSFFSSREAEGRDKVLSRSHEAIVELRLDFS